MKSGNELATRRLELEGDRFPSDQSAASSFGLGLRGGIHDVALTLGIPVIQGLDLLLRVRLVGGGADVPTRDIYNWGNFGFALVGLRVDLPLLWSQR